MGSLNPFFRLFQGMHYLENLVSGNNITGTSLEVEVMLLLATIIFAHPYIQYYSISFINSFWTSGRFQQILGGKKHENDCLVSFLLQKYLYGVLVEICFHNYLPQYQQLIFVKIQP